MRKISDKTLQQIRQVAELHVNAGIINREELDNLLQSATKDNQEFVPKPTILISRAKGAKMLGVSVRGLDRIIKSGAIARVHVGKRSIRLNEREIERYIEVNGGTE